MMSCGSVELLHLAPVGSFRDGPMGSELVLVGYSDFYLCIGGPRWARFAVLHLLAPMGSPLFYICWPG